jgi:competence protein ComEA
MQDQNRLSKFFSFTRSEIRGLIVLCILIITLLVVRFLIHRSSGNFSLLYSPVEPSSQEETEIDAPAYTDYVNLDNENYDEERSVPDKIDPNSSGYIELIRSGISASVAKHIIAYREHGGRFSVPGDLLKIDGIDTFLLMKLDGILVLNPKPRATDKYYFNAGVSNNLIIELNRTDSIELVKLPGIGLVLSARIVRYRNALGGFYSPHQLSEVYGISDSLFQTISKNLVADTLLIKKIELNTVSFAELLKHPYLDRFQVKAILNYRRLAGPFKRINELKEYYLIPDENYDKIKPYLVLK